MRKALLIGINDYPSSYKLNGCVNDVKALAPLLRKDENGDPNFDVKALTDVHSSGEARNKIYELFKGDGEVALLYFSGHGYADATGAQLVFPNDITVDTGYNGLMLSDIMSIVNASKVKNKVIILDCCHSGGAGNSNINTPEAQLYPGVTIMTACRSDEASVEKDGHGVFTRLLCQALKGEAADVCGNITLSSVYSFIDRMFGPWEQRPIFKTNVSSFVPIRKIRPRVSKEIIRKITHYFPSNEYKYPLDPSYEYTNSPEYAEYYKNREPLATTEHVQIFQELQQLQKIGLVEPYEEKYMYWAAINSKSCQLTMLGKHYWQLVKNDKI